MFFLWKGTDAIRSTFKWHQTMRTHSLPQSAPKQSRVITKAALRAAERLEIKSTVLAKILGISEPTVSRMRKGTYELGPDQKSFELAVLLVRLYRSLDGIVAGDDEVASDWLRNRNTVLNGVPLELIQTISGLTNVIEYLELSTSYRLAAREARDALGELSKRKIEFLQPSSLTALLSRQSWSSLSNKLNLLFRSSASTYTICYRRRSAMVRLTRSDRAFDEVGLLSECTTLPKIRTRQSPNSAFIEPYSFWNRQIQNGHPMQASTRLSPPITRASQSILQSRLSTRERNFGLILPDMKSVKR